MNPNSNQVPQAPQQPDQPATPPTAASQIPTTPEQPVFPQPMATSGAAAPTPQPATLPAQSAPAAPVSQDPGKKLGTFSIALCWLSLFATVIGIVGLVKSKKAGYKGTRAIVGIILSLVVFVVGIVAIVLITTHFLGMTTYSSSTYEVSLKIPAIWDVKKESGSAEQPKLGFYTSEVASGSSALYRAGAELICAPSKSGVIAQDKFTEEMRTRAKANGDTGIKPLTINGYPAVQGQYDDSLAKVIDTYYLTKGGTEECYLKVFDNDAAKTGSIFTNNQASQIAESFKRS